MLRLGKLPFVPDRRDLQYNWFRQAKLLPTRPKYFGNEKLISEWGILGNQDCGDCVWASGAHQHMLWCAANGKEIKFNTEDVIAAYTAATGYNPADPNSDIGTEIRAALKYRKTVGLKDSAGDAHKIGAFVRLEPGNTDHLFEALYLFQAVEIGLSIPQSAIDQFEQWEPWKLERGMYNYTVGGHDVPLVAKRKRLKCVTWGRTQEMTIGFYKSECDEAWGILSEDQLKEGKNFLGMDIPALTEALDEVGGEVE